MKNSDGVKPRQYTMDAWEATFLSWSIVDQENVPMGLGSPPSMLTVQTCECGAVRDYRGPAYGYVEIKR